MSDPILPPPADKPPMPPQPKTTTELPAVPPWAIELTQNVKAGFARLDGIEEKVDHVAGAVKSVQGEIEDVRGQMHEFREWKGAIDDRLKNNSMRAQTVSHVDATQDAAIAHLTEKVEANSAKVDEMAKTLEGSSEFRKLLVDTTKEALGNPMVKRLGQAAAAAAIAALTYLTAYLQLRGH